jgi:hypothetical protein
MLEMEGIYPRPDSSFTFMMRWSIFMHMVQEMSRTLLNFEQLYLKFYLELLAACLPATACRVSEEGGQREDAAAQGE